MGTITKALTLLDYFNDARPDIGLSDIARLAHMDKATAYRLLSEMRTLGFVEQDAMTKLFRLGPAVIRLANVREQTFPVRKAAEEHLRALVSDVRETAHVTELHGTRLSPVCHQDSTHHPTRAHIDPAEILPLYGTASGCAVMAFSDDELMQRVLAEPLTPLTPLTVVDPARIRDKVMQCRKDGFAVSQGEVQQELFSIGTPLFGADGQCSGAVSVVYPAVRDSKALRASICDHLKESATAITLALGGQVPPRLIEIWRTQKAA